MKHIVKETVRKSFQLVGLEVKRKPKDRIVEPYFVENQVVPNIWKRPVYTEMLPYRFPGRQPVVLLGNLKEITLIASELAALDIETTSVEWDWTAKNLTVDPAPNARIVLCKVPMNDEQWRTVKKLKEQYGSRVIGLPELVLPFTTIRQAQDFLEYYVGTLEKIAPYYTGHEFFGPLDELNRIFPLKDKTVIEFGPMDGAQTAGLVNLGAKSVTCIEARAESFIKTAVAKYAFRWENVQLVMDDFHNADNLKYGGFDLVFAHGVYYHSIAPFFFFENLMSLSHNIFIGGYVHDELNPSSYGHCDTLEYAGKKYRVKRVPMGQSYNTGVNKFGFHFCRDDLVTFFAERNYEVTVITDEESPDPWGDRYLRFLASKT